MYQLYYWTVGVPIGNFTFSDCTILATLPGRTVPDWQIRCHWVGIGNLYYIQYIYYIQLIQDYYLLVHSCLPVPVPQARGPNRSTPLARYDKPVWVAPPRWETAEGRRAAAGRLIPVFHTPSLGETGFAPRPLIRTPHGIFFFKRREAPLKIGT